VNATRTDQPIGERSMGYGLRVLGRIAGSDTLERIGMRGPLQRAIYRGSRGGFRTATRAGRTFKAAQKLAAPARQSARKPAGEFDITPDEEQQLLTGMIREFAGERIRPQAGDADRACAAPPELLAELTELGVGTLGIPEELGGVMHEQAAVTGALAAEALAHGDMGVAYAALAPAAVAGAIGHWGTAEQQARYLPAFAGDNPPVAALATLEPQPLFDPLDLDATARRDGEHWVINATKTLIARPGECELFIIAANAEGIGPALFLIESASDGISVTPEPAMGLRAAATGRLTLQDVRVSADTLMGDGQASSYLECVHRARLAWCAVTLGTCQAVLDHVIPYVNERSAFGEPISNRQAVAFAVADIATETEAIRLLALRAAARADHGESFARETSLARRLTRHQAPTIGSQGVQLLGGHGYITEHPVERWYRDLSSAGVMEGALLI